MPLATQIVQVGHACLEAGNKFKQPEGEPSYLVVLEVKDKDALLEAISRTNFYGVQITPFYEPDYDLGYTAACTEPVEGETKRVFKKYPLWKNEREK